MLQYLFRPTTHDGAALVHPSERSLKRSQHDDLWDPRNGYMAAFKDVGLPYSRAAIQEIVRLGRLPPARAAQDRHLAA